MKTCLAMGMVATLGLCSCGNGGGTPADGGASAEESSGGGSNPTTTATTAATEADSSGGGSNSNSNSNSASDTDPGTTETGPGEEGGSGPKLDLGAIPDTPAVECGGQEGGGGGFGGGVELSYIWISDTYQVPSSISKINTVTMVEEGRYMAKPTTGDASRTSVNLRGDVAVANRNGGVAKFYANVADCVESNGQAGIQTSSGLNDILAWEDEECRAWYHDFVCSSNRPVAWTRGEWDPATCSYVNMKLWTVCDGNTYLLDGDDGEIEQTVVVPGGGSPFVYGGAADADGNFWGLNTGTQQIYRVDHQDYSTVAFPLPPSGGYGITVDHEGRPWVSGGGTVSRFNLDDSTWTSSGGGGGIGGCMTNGVDRIWHSDPGGTLLGFDLESLAVMEMIVLPEYVHGVSVDFQGKVWGVSFAGNNAYRGDPDTGMVDTFSQLTQAYTYSDMTGFALSSAGSGQPPS